MLCETTNLSLVGGGLSREHEKLRNVLSAHPVQKLLSEDRSLSGSGGSHSEDLLLVVHEKFRQVGGANRVYSRHYDVTILHRRVELERRHSFRPVLPFDLCKIHVLYKLY